MKEVYQENNAFKLLKGKNIPYTGYKERMKKRVKDAEKLAKDEKR